MTHRTGGLTPWLRGGANTTDMLDQLVDGGLVVTDGCMASGRYSEFARFNWMNEVGAKAVDQVRPFLDRTGRRFECIGYMGTGYGLSLVWRVKSP